MAGPAVRPRARRWGLWGALGLIPLLLALFAVWAFVAQGPSAEAEFALMGGLHHEVTRAPEGWAFTPDEPPAAGVVLYPGAKIDPRSYAPLAADLAERGVLVVVTPMRFGLAVLSPDRADAAIAAHPEIETWVLVGHSLGGVAASGYVAASPDAVDGLVLLAAFPGPDDDLSDLGLPVVSLLGTEDGIVHPAEYEAAKSRLPEDTVYGVVTGGDHAQFGSYGPQEGDGEATVSAVEQRAEAVEAVTGLLD